MLLLGLIQEQLEIIKQLRMWTIKERDLVELEPN
jgi:hypothetical protein